jgi:hypothetical protein
MHVLYLPSEHALFFGADYYAENKGGLDPVIEKVQPKIFKTLPDDEGAIGSLPLPNGGVYVDCRAERSLRVFRGEGIQAFPSSVSLGKWAWGMQASMHCATNEVFLFPGATGFFDR